MSFDYDRAFSRNRGLISAAEQATLRGKTVAIAGAGGVGGWHALALARQGVGSFRLADPDRFDVVNFNRQAAATMSSVGLGKAETLRRMILDVNPEATVVAWDRALDEHNIAEFLDGADVVIDGIDFFALEARRLLFRTARERGLWALTAGPVGFGAAFLAFDPEGMPFDEYFGFQSARTYEQKLVAFLAGLAPRALHAGYMDFRAVDAKTGAGPSSVAACMLCGGLVAVQCVALLLGRQKPRAAPHYAQWDLYRGKLTQGTLRGGGNTLLHRARRSLITWRLTQLGILGKGVPA